MSSNMASGMSGDQFPQGELLRGCRREGDKYDSYSVLVLMLAFDNLDIE